MSLDEQWSLVTAEAEGKPVIFRIRNGAPAYAQKAEFPHLIAVSWPYQSSNGSGMPAGDDTARMGELEELLLTALEEEAQQAFVTIITTGNGVREWQWYARDPQETMRLVNEALHDSPPFPVQFSIYDDPDWEAYAQLQEAISS